MDHGDGYDVATLASELLDNRKLVLASNRGPVEFAEHDGKLTASRGSGGVVTALTAVSRHVPLTWVAAPLTAADRSLASRGAPIDPQLPDNQLSIRFVDVASRLYRPFYNRFCNEILWFLHHYLWNSPYTPIIDGKAYHAWNAYEQVNQAFGRAVVQEIGDGDAVVMLHDYHLFLAGLEVRQRLPRAIIQHFTHIPWPGPGYWDLLPVQMRTRILEGVTAANIVGLQTRVYARNFLQSCEAILPGAEVDQRAGTVWHNGRLTLVRHYPIAIDVEQVRNTVDDPTFEDAVQHLGRGLPDQVIVRVDRLDLSKNIIRGFLAFETLLLRRPDLNRRVCFLAFLVPSRTDVPEYRQYARRVFAVVDRINRRFGAGDWQPIRTFFENNYRQAIAGMSLADVLLVNPLGDGMNLVAKEGVIASRRAAAIVLSETAGAYEQLSDGVISVAATDVEGTSLALERALSMSRKERQLRLDWLLGEIEREDLTWWLGRQFEDLISVG